MQIDPAAVLAAVGVPAPEQAAAILAGMPASLLDRVRDPETVGQLVFGLLLSADPAVRGAQVAALGVHEPAAAREADALAGLHPMLRLPLAELAFPLLRGRPDVLAHLDALIAADGRVEVFEYCLSGCCGYRPSPH